MKFSELNLSSELLKMLEERNFVETTQIQEKAIPLLLDGKDVVGLSQTGTGKTLAFSLPILEKIDEDEEGLLCLVLCPTRELASQIKKEFHLSSKYKKFIKSVAVYGGADIKQQIFDLKKKPQIVVGTPGRILDHIKRHTLKLKTVKMLVLDEADEMFNMGFRKDILEILKHVPGNRQTMLFSATMNDEVLVLSKDYMNEPVSITVGEKNSTLDTISQTYFLVPKDKKKKALHSLLSDLPAGKTLIFCNTKNMVGVVQSYLEKMRFKVAVLHGDMPQSQRNQVMKNFKAGKIDILVTTDVAARGIDVEKVLHVVNFDLPQNLEYYVHRIGRCGRAGNKGFAWTILNSKDQEKKIFDLKKKLKCEIKLSFLKLSNIEENEQNLFEKAPKKQRNLKPRKQVFKDKKTKTKKF